MKRILFLFFILTLVGCLLQEAESGKSTEVYVSSSNGKRIYVHVHIPSWAGVFPTVILVPGGVGDGNAFDTRNDWANANNLARHGMVAIHFDPQGRGRSEGNEDYDGFIHQDDLKTVVEYAVTLPSIDKNNIGIVTFSYGIQMGAGTLGRYDLPVRYLLDVEGPSSREYTTKHNSPSIVRILGGHTTSDDAFWSEREAVRFIGKIKARYYRLQAEIDHAQGRQVGHAIELINEATRNGVWNRCNRNPPNIFYDVKNPEKYDWISGRLKDHNEECLQYLLAVAGIRQPISPFLPL